MNTKSDNWNHLMRQHDMKYIGFKDQRENKQNSDNTTFNNILGLSWCSVLLMVKNYLIMNTK
jgi:hypothetical protein